MNESECGWVESVTKRLTPAAAIDWLKAMRERWQIYGEEVAHARGEKDGFDRQQAIMAMMMHSD